jgi:hypothetical protein
MASFHKLILLFAGLSFFCLKLTAQQQEVRCSHYNKPLAVKSAAQSSANSNSRSDTIDIINYNINLDITNFTARRIKGNCIVTFVPKRQNVNHINLDLLKMTVDSVKSAGAIVNYTYNDTMLRVNLPVAINQGDTTDVQVFYQGVPQSDQMWGGFYFQSGYAYNLGVGFAADPHPFGRVWFPCFDNFVERSTYEFNILTSQGRKAFCGGELISETVAGTDSVIRKWVLNEQIPTYLASVAVANYTSVNYNYQGLTRDFPVVLAALPSDTVKMKNSFVNLNNAISAYEDKYHPYVWSRVGFTLVPFSSGAMEHATNIAYPGPLTDGSLTYETLMAHELSHHWWGNLLTCETSEDMWINEGWATYSEHLFLEKVYGNSRYIAEVEANHDKLLHTLHNKEGMMAISGVPHQYTYGDHVYKKGASVAHSLRGYLGDNLFFSGINGLFDSLKFTHINSYDLRDILSVKTGFDLTDFFKDFVFNPGFSDFAIDSISIDPAASGVATVQVYVRQTLKGSNHFYNNVPLTFSFLDQQMNHYQEKRNVSGPSTALSFTVPFQPVLVQLNRDKAINTASSNHEKIISAPGNYNFDIGKIRLEVSSASGNSLVLAEHHWVSPEETQPFEPYLKISPQRYWKIDGITSSDFQAKIRFNYDRRPINLLDHELFSNSADSLILLHRKDASDPWKEFDAYTQNPTSSGAGNFTTERFEKGEYVLAYGDKTILSIGQNLPSETLKIFPNPTSEKLTVVSEPTGKQELLIYDLKGNLQIQHQIIDQTTVIDVSFLPQGIYIITAQKDGLISRRQKLVIAK